MKESKKNFSWKIIIFLILYFIFFWFFNQYAFFVIKKSMEIFKNDIMFDEYLKQKENKKIENSFFGSSQVRNAIYPGNINNSYNFGNGGERYVESYCKLKMLIDEGVVLENIFISYDFSDFTKDYLAFERLKLNYYEGCVSTSEMSEFRKEKVFSTYAKTMFPLIGNGEDFVISQFGLYSPHEDRDLGWINDDKILSLGDKFESKKLYELSLQNNIVESLSLKYFLKIIDLARENNLNIFLVRYPMHREYESDLNKQIEKVMREVQKELDLKINKDDYVFLDYFDLFFDKPRFFKDYMHVNSSGAKVLSRVINEDLKNL